MLNAEYLQIKSFLSASAMRDFEMALGQYILYRNLINLTEKLWVCASPFKGIKKEHIPYFNSLCFPCLYCANN
ncbi:element excision factor XisH family protein [Okeania sp. SIO3B5]|uniref:element excision factor XisH family protein n=1 Tax=Okeania sp. SIO3B5 TaxID=2607811 RepID=UPI0025D7EABB|nr:element excision factor XisH family protein [Okeania sp. SIO3B5]